METNLMREQLGQLYNSVHSLGDMKANADK